MSKLLLLAAFALLAPGVAVSAEDVTPRDLADAGLPAGVSSREVDESRLRYFVARGDKAREMREIERLRKEHPDWNPPYDILDLNPTTLTGDGL
jgi:hypothetical protein